MFLRSIKESTRSPRAVQGIRSVRSVQLADVSKGKTNLANTGTPELKHIFTLKRKSSWPPFFTMPITAHKEAAQSLDSKMPRDQPSQGESAPQDLIARISTIDRACAVSPPDGGIRAWSQVLAGHLIVFNTWGYMISFGIFQPHYVESLGMESWAIAWIGSVQICLIFLVGTFSGRAFDAGYYKAALVIGSILQLVGILATSVGHTYWQIFLAQGICQGLGCGIVFAPTVANISTYFSKRRSMAVSASACGGATGGMVFPLMAQQLLPKIGLAWTVRAMGLVVLVSSVMVYLLARPRLPPRKSGPIVEMAAFREITYLLFAISMFFTLWAAYFAYYFVSCIAISYQRWGMTGHESALTSPNRREHMLWTYSAALSPLHSPCSSSSTPWAVQAASSPPSLQIASSERSIPLSPSSSARRFACLVGLVSAR